MKKLSFIVLLALASCTKEPLLPAVDFSFENSQPAPVTITFTNSTLFADSYFWDFGDGTYSKQENPAHIFHIPGKYYVSLKATNAEGSSIKEDTLHIRGTIYRILNNCSHSLDEVIGFTIKNNKVEGVDNFGGISQNQLTSYAFTESPEISVGIHLQASKYFIVTPPFLIYKDQENILKINDYVLGYVMDFSKK